MKQRKFQLGILAVVLGFAVQARASFFDITFDNPPDSVTGSGWLGASANVDGSFTVTSGSLTVVDPKNGIGGTFGLFVNPNGQNASYSPSGFFIYDNQLFPETAPFLDSYGLLYTGNGLEINLWGNGSDPNVYYTIYGNNGVNYNGSATLTAVPEPTTMIAGALLLLPFGASTLRILRKKQAA